MKKYFKYVVIVMVFLFTLCVVDMVCYSYFGTKPLVAKKEVINNYSVDVGVLYRTILSDIYYCDTTVDTYDDNGMNRQQKMIRYVIKKGDTFTCKSNISYYNTADDYTNSENHNDSINDYLSDNNPSDIEYMKYYVKDLYNNNLDGLYGINNKLNILIYNFNGLSTIDEKYYDVYMFDYNDFTKDPVKLSIESFDLVWRGTSYKSSPSGEILSFYYNCGYHEGQWLGEQKYTKEDCENNRSTSGIYVFKVNNINNFEEIAYFPESNNDYVNEYKDSYFGITEVLNDEEMIITYVITNNKQEEPFKKVNYIWNFIDNTIKEQVG